MTEFSELERAVRIAGGLAEAAEALSLQLDLPALDPIDLPPVVGTDADQARLRSVPPLYLASELEGAQLLSAADALAGVFASGGIDSDVGGAAQPLIAFWHARHDRFAPEERRAFFARLFGGRGPSLAAHGGVNDAFEGLLVDVTQALAELGARPLQTAELTLRAAASELAGNVASRTSGIPEPTARVLIASISEALALFKEPLVQAALGTHSPWAALRAAAQRYLRTDPAVEAHVERGKDGMVVLSWLAEAVTTLDTSRPLLQPDARTVAAAVGWLNGSLALRRGEAAAAA
jgi:hypothetical protein